MQEMSFNLCNCSIDFLLKDTAVILVPPDEDLGYGAKSLDKEPSIVVGDCLVLTQHCVQEPVGRQGTASYTRHISMLGKSDFILNNCNMKLFSTSMINYQIWPENKQPENIQN